MSGVTMGAYTAAWNTCGPRANQTPCRCTGLPSPRLPWAVARRLPGNGNKFAADRGDDDAANDDAGRGDSATSVTDVAAMFASVVLRHCAKTCGAALASGIVACAMAKLAPSASQAVMCRVTVSPASGTLRWWWAGLQGIMAVKSVSAMRVSRQFRLGLHALKK